MKTYAHFTTDGKENLGSDAWYRLDGRRTIRIHRLQARYRKHQLRFVQPHYNGFQIRQGDKPSTSKVIYSEMKTKGQMSNLRHLARDQWGRTIFLLTKFPRKELMENMGVKRASKMYYDKGGKSYHCGYIVAGHWWSLYTIKPVENPA